MSTSISAVLCLVLAAVSALRNSKPDPVILKWSGPEGLRYDYKDDGEGNIHQVDQWMKASDVAAASRYNPDIENVLHLFTRANPSVSQPVVLNNNYLLSNSNFYPNRRTIIIAHGWTQSATSNVNIHLVPAFLAAGDFNVFVLDWSAGASVGAGVNGPVNGVNAGFSLARFINWVLATTGTYIDNFHLVGFSLGAHLVAVAGRNVNGRIPYITALDPGANMEDSGHIFSPNAAIYTEAIHTNAAIMGHGGAVAHVDFYPNGGDFNPGCGVANFLCNHYRSFQFFAETLTTTTGFSGLRCQTVLQARAGLCFGPGRMRMGGVLPKTGSYQLFAESLYTDGFTGRRCGSYAQARLGSCVLPGNLRMGGINPKSGSGIFHLVTNDRYPYNRS